jgi:superfamily II DNA or RNA helicase
MINQSTPSYITFEAEGVQLRLLKQALTFTDKQAEQAHRRFRYARWYIGKYGEEAFEEELERLKGLVSKCLLHGSNFDEKFYTYSGLAGLVSSILNQKVVNTVKYPEPDLVAWHNKPTFELHYYQKAALEKLLEARHAGVEIGTGLGKSYIILHLAKSLGLPTVIMAPSTSIADQLYETFKHHLGPKQVGKCYGGKVEFKKLFTIALPQTLINIKPGNPAFVSLSKTKVFIADESHLCPAETLSQVCFGLMENAPYRFFFSATQLRNDGKDLLLDAITGPIVYKMTVREGVDQGFLAKPVFKMVKTYSDYPCTKEDPNDNTREDLLYNPRVIRQAAMLANNFVKHLNHQVLILVDEVEQFTKLLPYLEYKAGFAHGPLSDNKSKVPEAYWKSEHTELVKQFNDGKLDILVGTSCISTGTDIRNVKSMIYLQGGRSEIQVKQAIGRATRKIPGKTECNIIDFDVVNNEVCHRHAEARTEIYDEIYGPVEEIKLE